MKLTGIVAMTPERVIGRGGDLPWHLPEDLKFFKRTTSGHPIVMGRKTYESIGRPLPGRQNIVLTRDVEWAPPDVASRHYVDQAPTQVIEAAEESAQSPHEQVALVHNPHDLPAIPLIDSHVFVIGGAQIYKLFLPLLDDLLVTWVYHTHEGDTFFPEFDAQFPRHEVVEHHDDFEIRHYTRSPGE